MISSCTKHSRSAQRRPCRSFSSIACAAARACDHLGLQQLRHGGAEHVLAAGMLGGERIDRGGDPRGIETVVGLRAASVTTLSMIYPDIGRRERCHGTIPEYGVLLHCRWTNGCHTARDHGLCARIPTNLLKQASV